MTDASEQHSFGIICTLATCSTFFIYGILIKDEFKSVLFAYGISFVAIFKRPGVAGAFLKSPPSLTDSAIL